MKKIILFSIALMFLCGVNLSAQSTAARGMNYQAVARDAAGQVIANHSIALKVALVSKSADQTEYYSETHQVTTDQNGLFKIVIGEGKAANGQFVDVPWAKDQVWLNIAMDNNGGKNFTLVSSAKLLSVPYAYHATTATQLVDPTSAIELPQEKNQSIYWTTGGNTNTRPTIHFLGTRDNQDLVIKTFDKIRAIETKEGQLQIKSGVDGADDDKKAYPLTIEGSKQGIWIEVNGGRSSANNFLVFADENGVHGGVEGETLGELLSSAEFISKTALAALQIVSFTAQLVALGIEVGGLSATGVGAGAAAGAAATAVAIGAEMAAFIIEQGKCVDELVNNVGVSFFSGAGDYAEWLKRKTDEKDMFYGEIVGVRAGVASRNTEQADHYLVISKRPIVLGNMPQKDQEHLFEKVAFMGQVPVKVAGSVAIGDYIIPSGNHDGIGIAVHPADMKIGDYAKIVGVAWQAAGDNPINYVNVAVGINANDLSKKVDELNGKVEQIMLYLEGKAALHGTDAQNIAALAKPSTTVKKMLTDEEFDQLIDKNADLYKEIFAQTKAELHKRGYEDSEMTAFLNDPIDTMKKMRRNPEYLTQWALIDRKIKSNR